MKWYPIETAPKDGTEVDLWLVDTSESKHQSYRLPNCFWGEATFQFKQPGLRWVTYGNLHGDFAIEPVEESGTIVATHWMPLPPPPEEPSP